MTTERDMDYLDPVKSVYAVPYRTAKRFFIALSGICAAYVAGAGLPVLVNNFAGLPASAVACLWNGPISGLTIPFTFFAFFYVVFSERRLLPVVAVAMILVYCHAAKPGWWMAVFWMYAGIPCGTYLLFRLFKRFHPG